MKTKFFPKWLWRLASVAVVLVTLIGSVRTVHAIPPEPIHDEPDEPAEVPEYFTWSMRARFGNDADGDGVMDYTYDPAYVNATIFTVKFKGTESVKELNVDTAAVYRFALTLDISRTEK